VWPVVFTIQLADGRSLPITSYGFLFFVAVLLCAAHAPWRARRMGLPGYEGHHLLAIGLAGGLIGARLLFIAFNLKRVVEAPWRTLALEGGLVWYGGVAGGALATILYARRYRIPLTVVFDLAAPLIAVGHAIGRVGCFLVGCCYGKPTSLSWGVSFPANGYFIGPPHVPLHPVQLYEALFELAMAAFLFAWGNRPRGGRVLAVYLATYAPFRFVMEQFFRADDRGTIGLPIAPSALVSVLALAASAYLFAASYRLTPFTNPR
jgi:phosphatidylglycerol---prolipoprotein diacylglyceryl transferase